MTSLSATVLGAAMCVTAAASTAAADVVVDWNLIADTTPIAGGPPLRNRMMAMVHVAVHDALNAMIRAMRPMPAASVPHLAPRRTPPSLPRHITCSSGWCRRSPARSARSTATTWPAFPPVRPGSRHASRTVWQSATRPRRPSSPCTPTTARRRRTSPTRRPQPRASTSRRRRRSLRRSSPAGRWSRRSCSTRDHSSVPIRRIFALTGEAYTRDFNEVKRVGRIDAETLGLRTSEQSGDRPLLARRRRQLPRRDPDAARHPQPRRVGPGPALRAGRDGLARRRRGRLRHEVPRTISGGRRRRSAPRTGWRRRHRPRRRLAVLPGDAAIPRLPVSLDDQRRAGAEVLRRYFGPTTCRYPLSAAGATRGSSSLSDAEAEAFHARVFGGMHSRSGCVGDPPRQPRQPLVVQPR